MTDWNGIREKKEELYSSLSSSIVDTYEGKCGIYQITIGDKLAYIGKSTNMLNRWIAHKINTLFNFHQHDYYEEKYEVFRDAYKMGLPITCSIVEECDEQELSQKEKYWINKLNPPLNGGNGAYWRGMSLLI